MSHEFTDDDGADCDTGPFCRHWGDPVDCSEKCEHCGHECCKHSFYGDGECNVDGCDCEGWVGDTE